MIIFECKCHFWDRERERERGQRKRGREKEKEREREGVERKAFLIDKKAIFE